MKIIFFSLIILFMKIYFNAFIKFVIMKLGKSKEVNL